MYRLTNVLAGVTPPAIDTSALQTTILSSVKDGVDAMNELLIDALPVVMTIIVAVTVVMFGIKLFLKITKKA